MLITGIDRHAVTVALDIIDCLALADACGRVAPTGAGGCAARGRVRLLSRAGGPGRGLRAADACADVGGVRPAR